MVNKMTVDQRSFVSNDLAGFSVSQDVPNTDDSQNKATKGSLTFLVQSYQRFSFLLSTKLPKVLLPS